MHFAPTQAVSIAALKTSTLRTKWNRKEDAKKVLSPQNGLRISTEVHVTEVPNVAEVRPYIEWNLPSKESLPVDLRTPRNY